MSRIRGTFPVAIIAALRQTAQSMREHPDLLAKLVEYYRNHPSRGGCGIGAVADLEGKSHDVIEQALRGLGCMEHRGGSIDDTGDGAGLLIGTDVDFFRKFIAPGRHLPEGHALAVGVVFFPSGESTNIPPWQQEIDSTLRKHGLAPLAWRKVPVSERVLGRKAFDARREIWQVLIGEGMVAPEDLDTTLYRVKGHLERWFRGIYIPSFSSRTVSYKALVDGDQLRRFYADLTDPDMKSDVVVFHRRYSTNTFSNWYLAQTFRLISHNGEINTIKANRNAVRNLEAELGMQDVLMQQGSDSADLDRVVELFRMHGVPLMEALARVMPMAYRDLPRLTPEVVRYYQGVERALGTLGAWEGPAAIVATDGDVLVGQLDRMGLRPLRWLVTRQRRIFIGSELGALDIAAEDILETGQLDPGQAVAVDLRAKKILRPDEVLARVVEGSRINFGELAEARLTTLPAPKLPAAGAKQPVKPDNSILNLFGWNPERVKTARHMAQEGKEPITSMGYDRPLAVFSRQRPTLAKYFKQIVAVVTNPPIDPIREGSAFDTTVFLGRRPTAHEYEPVYNPEPQYRLPMPFITEDQTVRIRDAASPDRPRCAVLDCTFEYSEHQTSKVLAQRIADLTRAALLQVKTGQASILLLSDKMALVKPFAGVDGGAPEQKPRLPLPMILAVSAVHNALVAEGRRRHASLIVETGEVQEGHDAAVLIANGADAIHPHLFLQICLAHYKPGEGNGKDPITNGLAGLMECVKRTMSKMGITSVAGYCASRLFEAVGLDASVVDYYLPGVQSHLGGAGLDEIYEDIVARWKAGARPQGEGDLAIYRKDVWNELQQTARGNPGAYERFLSILAETPPVYLRDLLRFRPAGKALPVAVVAAPEEIIASTFRGAAMSHGALHRVAHRAIAAAFNAMGAMSNCGEGGEDDRRDRGRQWEADRSRIRQVGSGRFGVDARYLAHADEISIKIGQGAKPGEGGMLPAAKVTAEVAAIRKTQVGVTLISPPPHHDIYSIEDLAQLIYNLKQANPKARVSVKCPAVTDIGTIAVGVAKAGADVIDISGFEGGTGAASSSSIEHAGLPLERGISEVHQALVINGIRASVRLRADGGIKTGTDIAAILALGADEVSLGTALMIAEQCIFCHGCAKGNCPAGITTQSDLVARRLMTEKKGRSADEQLADEEEARYLDAKKGVETYLMALAGDLRARLAELGLRHPSELVGRVDLLEQRVVGDARIDKVDLSEVLTDPHGGRAGARAGRAQSALHIDVTSELNARIVAEVRGHLAGAGSADIQPVGPIEVKFPITNVDRAVGATLAYRMVLGELDPRAADGARRPVHLTFEGYAGQALGFNLIDGMYMRLDGYANDSVGEAMSGGKLVVRQPRVVDKRSDNSAIGNAACYGATGGTLYVEGRAGQRLGVRNSGAIMVTEGAGKYAFEYMTGGVGVVLGPVNPVLGSGMTGGVVWLLDEDGLAAERLHKDVKVDTATPEDLAGLRGLIQDYAAETGSERAKRLLLDWATASSKLLKVVPSEGGITAKPLTVVPRDESPGQLLQIRTTP